MTERNSVSDLPAPPLEVIYSGHVQGVGFRWTCQSISRRHPVTGTVRNRSDGTVELRVDGRPADVKLFLADIVEKLSGNIQDSQISQISDSVEFDGFQIIR